MSHAIDTSAEWIAEDHDAFARLIDPEAPVEILAEGFRWAEGPVWWTGDGGPCLLFSDIPNNRIMRWSESDGLSLFMKPSGYTGVADYGAEPGSNGLTRDPAGRLVLCEHGDRRMSVLLPDGGKRTLVDAFQGRRLNSPNDCVYRSNGDLYFTDPPYGLPDRWNDPRRELDFCGLFRLAPDGRLDLLTDALSRPNGLAFSPDESILYVANSDPQRAIWMAFPVGVDGSLGEGRQLFDTTGWLGDRSGLPDGLKVDRAGNLFATAAGGLWVLDASGALLGRIAIDRRVANCCWGDDGSSLYLCATDRVCRLRTRTVGVSLPQADR